MIRSFKKRSKLFKDRVILNINQKNILKISSVFNYMFVVVLQYILPMLIILFTTLMYKTLSDYQWTTLFKTFSKPPDENAVQLDNLLYSFKEVLKQLKKGNVFYIKN